MTHAPIFSGDGYHCTRCNLSWDQGEGFRAKMVAGLSARLSGKADTPMAREAAQMDLGQVVMACARNAGLRPANVRDAVSMRGLWTTSDFTRILDGSLGNEVARQIGVVPIAIERAARSLDRPDYRLAWEKKLAWYRAHGVLPAEEGGGSAGMLVTTTESAAKPFDGESVKAAIALVGG